MDLFSDSLPPGHTPILNPDLLSIGLPQTRGGLTVFPICLRTPLPASDYALLDEALADGSATVTEVSDSGSVPELLLRNGGGKPVLLLDGEELVGAKQNRVLNLTILAPAGKDLRIPVSCVEAGRWSWRCWPRPQDRSSSRA